MPEGQFLSERGVLYRSFEMQLSEDRKGMWTGSQVYHCHRDDFAEVRPARKSAHPVFPWVTVDTLEIVGMEGDWIKLVAQYVGQMEDGGAEGGAVEVANYEKGMRLSTTESPAATNPFYDSVSAKDKQEAIKLASSPQKKQDGGVKQVDTSEWDALKVDLYDSIRKGNTHFKDPQGEYFIRYTSAQEPIDRDDIGKISDPPGLVPAIGEDWLLVGYNVTERADIFEIEKVWQRSGRGGWRPDWY